jgi:tRNA G37 N-methylase TrmD
MPLVLVAGIGVDDAAAVGGEGMIMEDEVGAEQQLAQDQQRQETNG